MGAPPISQDAKAADVGTEKLVTVVDHPLVHHKLSLLRDVTTGPQEFRQLANELALLLTYEATRDLALHETEVTTPLETTSCLRLAEESVCVVPILRAGMGMLNAVLELLPTSLVGFVGLYRDEETATPVQYYAKFPPNLNERTALILDPMLATGGSAAEACALLKAHGAKRIVLVCLVASPEGVERLGLEHPEVRIVTAAVDRQLNEASYILPGLGDAGDRLFGTK